MFAMGSNPSGTQAAPPTSSPRAPKTRLTHRILERIANPPPFACPGPGKKKSPNERKNKAFARKPGRRRREIRKFVVRKLIGIIPRQRIGRHRDRTPPAVRLSRTHRLTQGCDLSRRHFLMRSRADFADEFAAECVGCAWLWPCVASGLGGWRLWLGGPFGRARGPS